MERIAIEDAEATNFGEESTRRSLSDPLGTTDVAINRYRLAPGEGLPGGLHAHADQEEVFVVLEGEATFEVLETADGAGTEITVGEGEIVRFAPGEFQSGRNDGDGELVVLALGAPRDSEDVRIPVACEECGREDLRLDFGGGELTFVCPDCETERIPDDCPECGHGDLRVTLGEGTGTVVVCRGCGEAFERPPTVE